MQIRTKYDRHEEGFENPDKGTDFNPKNPESRSLTRQNEKDSCDLNKQLAAYEKTGVIPDVLLGTPRAPMYGDFTGMGDYHAVKSRITAAEQAFEALPASTRNRFDNDVQKLCDFLVDPKNDEEAVKLGLREPFRADEKTPPDQKELPAKPDAPVPPAQ